MSQAPELRVALIEIGSDALRLTVAEFQKGMDWRIVERAENPLMVGHDIFNASRLERTTLYRLLTILQGYLELVRGLGFDRSQILLTATTALREAKNHAIVADRIKIKTGLTLNFIEGVEATHLTYSAVEQTLKPIWSQRFSRSNAFILEVGGSTSEVLLLNRGKIASAHTLRIGSVRFQEQYLHHTPAASLERVLREQMSHLIESLDEDFDLQPIRTFVAVGSDIRIAADAVGQAVGERHTMIPKDALNHFIDELRHSRPDQLVLRYNIPWHDAESLLPSLLIYRNFFEATSAEELIVPHATLRDGIFLRLSRQKGDLKRQNLLLEQVRASARGIARKYHCNEEHGTHIAMLGTQLFDLLIEEHGLEAHDRLLLEVAAQLHEVGKFIAQSAYHKHGEYIVLNSQIFGLSTEDHQIVANVVRYQRRALPLPSHLLFGQLSLNNRIRVMKIAGILRLIVAMERGHSLKVQKLDVVKEEEDLSLIAFSSGDLSLERSNLDREKNLFEEVFGLRVQLVDHRTRQTTEDHL
jgi:exopolyphosphatase/guanosine-5'-triphosphate,3'-diphosphate pyrophosphatase